MSAPCGRPFELAALADYWLDTGVHDEVEEHLLGCDSCSRRLQGLVALGSGVRRLVREGTVELVLTPSLLATAREQGLRIREYRIAPGERVSCTVTADDDLLVSRLVGRFEGVRHLDVAFEAEGRPARRILDVPLSPGMDELVVAQAMPQMRALQHARVRIRLLAQEPGGERALGEYTFDHHPTPSSD